MHRLSFCFFQLSLQLILNLFNASQLGFSLLTLFISFDLLKFDLLFGHLKIFHISIGFIKFLVSFRELTLKLLVMLFCVGLIKNR